MIRPAAKRHLFHKLTRTSPDAMTHQSPAEVSEPTGMRKGQLSDTPPPPPALLTPRLGLTSYGDAEFSLFLRKVFIKGAGYTEDALDRKVIGIVDTGVRPSSLPTIQTAEDNLEWIQPMPRQHASTPRSGQAGHPPLRCPPHPIPHHLAPRILRPSNLHVPT